MQRNMKTTITDPWSAVDSCGNVNEQPPAIESNPSFEDSFVLSESVEVDKLPDSEQYLARLQSRLKAIRGGTSKRDLIDSLSVVKEDCIARLIKAGGNLETAEEEELATNPVIRHIAPHLQALTANELVHLLKSDFLQAVVDEQNQVLIPKYSVTESSDSQPPVENQNSN